MRVFLSNVTHQGLLRRRLDVNAWPAPSFNSLLAQLRGGVITKGSRNMSIARSFLAFSLAVTATYIAASSFYTQQVLAKQVLVGAQYTGAQQVLAYRENFLGLLGAYLPILAIALAIGFLVAALVKRIAKPLAPVAYPTAGFCAVVAAIYLIENVMLGGGIGVIGGARDAVGLSLQGFSGGIGGLVFSLLSARKERS